MDYIKKIIQLLQRKDIYYCITPLIVCLLNILYQMLDKSHLLNGWRIYKKSSPLEKYTIFQSKSMLFHIIIILFLYIFVLILAIPLIIKIENENTFNKFLDAIFIFVCIISCIVHFFILNKRNDKNDIIKFNRKIKNKNQIVKVVYYLPTMLEGVVLTLSTIFKDINIIISILVLIYYVFLIVFYLFVAKILDNNFYYEYKYICFNFNDGKKLENVLVKNIQKKGTWIIVKVNDEHEIRFKNEILNSVEYKNETL